MATISNSTFFEDIETLLHDRTVSFNNSEQIQAYISYTLTKGLTNTDVVNELHNYCDGRPPTDYRCCVFVRSVLQTMCFEQRCHEPTLIGRILRLLWRFTQTFHELFDEAYTCADNFSKLRYFLKYSSNLLVEATVGRFVRFIDAPLLCGETALMLSCRLRRPTMTLLLLQHGASIHIGSSLGTALDILLFAPYHIATGETDISALELCLCYFLRVVPLVDMRHFMMRESDGFHAIHPLWRRMVPSTRYVAPCELKHWCRITIRSRMNTTKQLPYGIETLPIPNILKKYLNLKSD